MTYEFRHKYLLMISGVTEIEGGFPHSEIRGSKVVRTSPRLIAAYHVLHRLSAPRHPPNTLKALDRSHYRRPPSCASADPKSLATFQADATRIIRSEKSFNFSGRCDEHQPISKSLATFQADATRISRSEKSCNFSGRCDAHQPISKSLATFQAGAMRRGGTGRSANPPAPPARTTSIERPFASNISENVAVADTPHWSLASAPLGPKRSDMLPLHDDSSTRRSRRKGGSLFQGRKLARVARHLVEPDGIEPTTSCLQSTRSPN